MGVFFFLDDAESSSLPKVKKEANENVEENKEQDDVGETKKECGEFSEESKELTEN